MRLFSYVVLRDFGFAPNPFYGYCTLATCKPDIRRVAAVGDWVVGTESKDRTVLRRRFGNVPNRDALVYAMQVSCVLTFNEYWADERFNQKRPYLKGSKKQAFGDNIYHRLNDGHDWTQENSHHTFPDGSNNDHNVKRDTKWDRVLVGERFVYFGANAKALPAQIGEYPASRFLKPGAGHRCDFTNDMIGAFVNWLEAENEWGYLTDPGDWNQSA